jgi:hypothetical protein
MELIYGENEFVRIQIENNIVYLEYAPETNIEILEAIKITELLSRMTKNNSFLVLENMSNIKWIDKQARDYLADNETTKKMKAWASYSPHRIHKIVHLIFINFSKPRVKINFFKDRKSAWEWLCEKNK